MDAAVVEINAGPTITQFGVEPGWDIKYKEVKQKNQDGKIEIFKEEVSRTRVKVDRISSLSNDISLALAAPTIRIEAPVRVNRSLELRFLTLLRIWSACAA